MKTYVCLFNSLDFEDGPLENNLYPAISEEKSTEVIREKYWDYAFALDVNMFKAHQAKDTKTTTKSEISKNKSSIILLNKRS